MDVLREYINFSWLYYGFLLVYAVTIVSIIAVVLSENRNPVKSLAWVTVLLMLPLFGIILYLFFGRSIKNKRMISRRNRRRLRRHRQPSKPRIDRLGLQPDSQRQLTLTGTLAGAQFYVGGGLDVFTDGASKFDRLFADIEAARSYVNIQYYIVEDDALGRRLADLLVRKAAEGVKVRLIYDHVGSFKARGRFFKRLREAGVEAYPFFKVTFPLLGTRVNWRNHRKICVIDGRVGYIGGMNVADRYIDGGAAFALWRDTHLRITGPAVDALQYSFAVDWNFMGQPLIEDDIPAHEEEIPEPTADGSRPEVPVMQLLTSGPTSQWTNIAFLYIRAIASAKRRVYIQTPYFLPTESLLKALQASALSGVDVRIMMPRDADSKMLTYASFSYITECLRSGIKIYLYTAGMLHAKTIIVDDEFVSVGSANFDFRSFEHNFEANMQIYSRQFCARMVEIFLADLQQCERVGITTWRKRSLMKKAGESILRLLSPIL